MRLSSRLRALRSQFRYSASPARVSGVVKVSLPARWASSSSHRLMRVRRLYGKISYILPSFDTITESSDFGSEVTLEILVLSEKLAALTAELTEVTNGAAKIEDLGELYGDFSSVKKIF